MSAVDITMCDLVAVYVLYKLIMAILAKALRSYKMLFYQDVILFGPKLLYVPTANLYKKLVMNMSSSNYYNT